MIKFSHQVPSVYTSASRDFQYLSWLINIVLNSVKHNVDSLYDLPNSQADPKLTELLATTLGFKIRRNYDQAQLKALVAALPRILKYKGTIAAINMAGNAILAASGAPGTFSSQINEDDPGELEVVFPITLVDISLFTDLLPYILPAGMTCHIIRENQNIVKRKDSVEYSDTLVAAFVEDFDWDETTNDYTGLSDMFDVGKKAPEFSNFTAEHNINIGLLDNSIIPMFTGASLPSFDYIEVPNEHGTTVIINHSFN